MDSYFNQLDGIVTNHALSNGTRSKIKSVINLRKNQWKPRREVNKPKTIEQIHEEVIREREKQDKLNRQPIITRNFRSGNYSGYARK